MKNTELENLPPYVELLPDDVWRNIFTFIDPVTLALSTALVSKIFLILSFDETVWEEKTKIHYPKTHHLLSQRKIEDWRLVFRSCAENRKDPKMYYTYALKANTFYSYHLSSFPSSKDQKKLTGNPFLKLMRNLLFLVNENADEFLKSKLESIKHEDPLFQQFFLTDHPLYNARPPFHFIIYKAIKLKRLSILKIIRDYLLTHKTYFLKEGTKNTVRHDYEWCTRSYYPLIFSQNVIEENIINELKNYKKKFDTTIVYGISINHLSAFWGYLKIAKYFYESLRVGLYSLICHESDYRSYDQMTLAIRGGQLGVLKFYHEFCSDWNAVDRKGRTQLYHAAKNGHFQVVKYIIEITSVSKTYTDPIIVHEFSLSGVSYSTANPVIAAYRNGHAEIGNYLADHIIPSPFGFNIYSLVSAAIEGDMRIIKYINPLKHFNQRGLYLAYQYAVKNVNREAAEYFYTLLLTKTHETAHSTHQEKDPATENLVEQAKEWIISENTISELIYVQSDPVLNMILKNFSLDPNYCFLNRLENFTLYDKYAEGYYDTGETLLTLAIKFTALNCAKVLLDNQADPMLTNKKGEVPLILAFYRMETCDFEQLFFHVLKNPLFDQEKLRQFFLKCIASKDIVLIKFVLTMKYCERYLDILDVCLQLNHPEVNRFIRNHQLNLIHVFARYDAAAKTAEQSEESTRNQKTIPYHSSKREREPTDNLDNVSIVQTSKRQKIEVKYSDCSLTMYSRVVYHLTLLLLPSEANLPTGEYLKNQSYSFPLIMKHKDNFYYCGNSQNEFKMIELNNTLLSLQNLNFKTTYRISVSENQYGDLFNELKPHLSSPPPSRANPSYNYKI